MLRPLRIRSTLTVAMLLVASLLAPGAALSANRDFLWETMSTCLDTGAFDYCGQCSVPRVDSGCPPPLSCEQSLEIWSESNNYVALRDRKMCGCPDRLVHGLVIPRAPVTGVEDPLRPTGIWSFAWKVARTRIAEESTIALAVNPPGARSQDQLHVHIVRLQKDARQRFAKLPTARVLSLDEVWRAAACQAQAQKLDDYGVLVATHPEGGFLVLVDRKNTEKTYTEATCR